MRFEPFHPFRSEQAKQEYLTFYDERAKGWPVLSESKMVTTSFGQTFVRISGADNAPPLVLLPGSVFHSLMWIPNIKALSQKFRTIAVDNIYDCGRSIYTRIFSRPEDLVGWLNELFDAIELGNEINMMGLSYGSWLAYQYTLRHPERVRKAVFLAHPTIVSINPAFLFRLLLSFLSPRFFRKFVEWLFEDTAKQGVHSGELIETIYKDMQLAGKCFKPKRMVNPTSIKDTELQGLMVPALFLFGENEKTFSSRKAIDRLNILAPQFKSELIPNAGHDMNFAQADLVSARVLKFLEQ